MCRLLSFFARLTQNIVHYQSKAPSTRDYAKYPTIFRQISQPETDYIALPEVSSSSRVYIPISYVSKDVICSNTIQFVPSPSFFIFGVLTSEFHMAWMRLVCGRLKSDYRYSNTVVYNNFPWPECTPPYSPPSSSAPSAPLRDNTSSSSSSPSPQVASVEKAAQSVLDARAAHPDASLADLYDPLSMPPDLVKAHKELDSAVDKCYRKEPFKTELERVEFLFGLYEKYTATLTAGEGRK